MSFHNGSDGMYPQTEPFSFRGKVSALPLCYYPVKAIVYHKAKLPSCGFSPEIDKTFPCDLPFTGLHCIFQKIPKENAQICVRDIQGLRKLKDGAELCMGLAASYADGLLRIL